LNILVVGLVDSIHLARWLSQFSNLNYVFWVFPSKKFKGMHPDLIELLKSHPSIFRLAERKHRHFLRIYGYLDFIHILLAFRLNFFSRANRLTLLLRENHFDLIHAIEFQGAAYLLEDISKKMEIAPRIIVTNYGSDIVFFAKKEEHRQKIVKVLQIADYYSAECERDYVLATELGFNGTFLPCIPNAGGFPLNSVSTFEVQASKRKVILVKSIGETFGLGAVSLKAISIFMKVNTEYEVCLYSVTNDLLQQATELKRSHPGRVEIITRSQKLSRQALLDKFSRSRVYLGCSASDGISTSFLESIIYGAYPIQTNTSCAEEWISKGFIGSTPKPSVEEILNELFKTTSDKLVDNAQEINQRLALRYLSEEVILKSALTFYEI